MALPKAAQQWMPLIEQAARSVGLDPMLLAALVWAESNFNANAVSSAGAIGLGQLMPGTAKDLGVDPRDPAQNLRGAARYLKEQLDRFGSVELALAAYNAGPRRVAKAGGIPNISETRKYVPKVLGYAQQLGWGKQGTGGSVAASSQMFLPVEGISATQLSDTFGAGRSGGRSHQGIDIFAPEGTAVVAVRGGTVVKAGNSGGLGGLRVWVKDDAGLFHYYAHLSAVDVKDGQRVEAGQRLGAVGNTGIEAVRTPHHLHYSVNPVGHTSERGSLNPYEFLTGALTSEQRDPLHVRYGGSLSGGLSVDPQEQAAQRFAWERRSQSETMAGIFDFISKAATGAGGKVLDGAALFGDIFGADEEDHSHPELEEEVA